MSDFDGTIDPSASWADIPQLIATAHVKGGVGDPMNAQAVSLAARTNMLNNKSGQFVSVKNFGVVVLGVIGSV